MRADADGTGVVVMQGKVKVNDRSEPIEAGQQLAPGSTDGAAPQAAHVLNWARELIAAAEAPLVPPSKYQGGRLVVADAAGNETMLSLRKYHIDVFIQDGFARTTIDQTYFNHNTQRLEGTFHFPLPPDASISRLAMYVDGVLTEGGMVETDYGRQVYDRIVHPPVSIPMGDPALLEWVDGNTFKMRVFPLEGRQEKRIVLSYTQRLPLLYGRLSYRFPAGHSLESVRDWSFHALVRNGADWKASSESHPSMMIDRRGPDLVLDDSAQNVKIDRDVAVDFAETVPPGDSPVARFSATNQDGVRYFMVRYQPKLSVKPEHERRDWVFLFESSGDRDPLLARVQVDVIGALLGSVEHDDTFAILTAGTQIHSFSPQPLPATPENIKAGIEFLENTHLVGAST